jgi:hypothetical protein
MEYLEEATGQLNVSASPESMTPDEVALAKLYAGDNASNDELYSVIRRHDVQAYVRCIGSFAATVKHVECMRKLGEELEEELNARERELKAR